MRRTFIRDLTGRRFGRLTVTGYAGHGAWRCRCECGNLTTVTTGHLNAAPDTRSCGRCGTPMDKTGPVMSEDRILKGVWRQMLRVCYDPNSHQYRRYGARGIQVCDRWVDSFDAYAGYVRLLGWREGMSVTRIDPDGDFTPRNIRISPPGEASGRNARPVMVTDSRTGLLTRCESVSAAARFTGLKSGTVSRHARMRTACHGYVFEFAGEAD